MLGYQVTLTLADTNYNLLTLVRAIDSAFVDRGDFVIQADDDGGAQVIKVGDANLAASRYGFTLTAGDYSAHFNSLAGLNARSSLAGKKLNISVSR